MKKRLSATHDEEDLREIFPTPWSLAYLPWSNLIWYSEINASIRKMHTCKLMSTPAGNFTFLMSLCNHLVTLKMSTYVVSCPTGIFNINLMVWNYLRNKTIWSLLAQTPCHEIRETTSVRFLEPIVLVTFKICITVQSSLFEIMLNVSDNLQSIHTLIP